MRVYTIFGPENRFILVLLHISFMFSKNLKVKLRTAQIQHFFLKIDYYCHCLVSICSLLPCLFFELLTLHWLYSKCLSAIMGMNHWKLSTVSCKLSASSCRFIRFIWQIVIPRLTVGWNCSYFSSFRD